MRSRKHGRLGGAWAGAAVVGGFFACAEAAGQPAMTVANFGACYIGDLGTNDPWTPASNLVLGTVGGLETTATGELWACGWNGDVAVWSPAQNSWRTRFNVNTAGGAAGRGFAKDLAWDPTRGRLLVLHTGVYPDARAPDAVNILAIEPVSGAVSLLGRVSGEGLSPSYRQHSPEGLAVDSAGTLWIATVTRRIYRAEAAAGGFQASQRAELPSTHQQVFGLAADWRRDDALYLCSGTGIWELGPDLATLRRASTLTFMEDLAIRPCEADVDTDGFVDFFDYLRFVDLFVAGSPAADLTHDGVVDGFDYAEMVRAFEEGC